MCPINAEDAFVRVKCEGLSLYCARSDDVAIVISSFCQDLSPIAPVWPFIVAEQLVKVTALKSVSGRTPDLDEGASAKNLAEFIQSSV